MSGTEVINTFGSKVYAFSSNKSWPEFIEEAIKESKSLKKNQEFKQRLEIIQGFQFTTHNTKVRISNDHNFIGAVGMYPPDLKVYDANELSMKFMRRVDSEIVDFQFLSDDYRKIALLQADRNIELHGQGGRHHKVRIPSFGRSMIYNNYDAELCVSSASPSIFRLDLNQGKFLQSFESSGSETLALGYNPMSHLLIGGNNAGYLELFDTREGIYSTAIHQTVLDEDEMNRHLGRAITAIDVTDDGKYTMVGCAQGIVKIYDNRMFNQHLYLKEHNVDSIITDVTFGSTYTDICSERIALSSDEHNVKVWKPMASGSIKNIASFHVSNRVNSIAHYPRSGLIFVAQDAPKVGVYFMPDLGIAPKWIPFADQIVEEMDQTQSNSLYEDFSFITRSDVQKLGCTVAELSGMIRPHQHGFLISKNDHRDLRVRANVISDMEIEKEQVAIVAAKANADDPLRTVIKISENSKIDEGIVSSLKNTIAVGHSSRTKKDRAKGKAAAKVLEDSRFGALLEE